MEVLTRLIDWLKSPRFASVLFISSLGLLCLPSGVVAHLGLTPYERYNGFVVIVLLLSGSVLLIECLIAGWNATRKKVKEKKFRKEQTIYLQRLTDQEKRQLKNYVIGNCIAWRFPGGDGSIAALVAKRLLYQASDMQPNPSWQPGHFDFNIEPWVKDYLNQNPHLLE